MRLFVATHNAHKIKEISEILPGLEIVADNPEGVEENAPDFIGNAQIKVEAIALCHPGEWCMADDSGLEVEALGGAPGVYSARYAGEHCSFDDNVNKLLAALDGVENRRADFRTVICLVENGSPRYFEGRVDGQILTERRSNGEGFGYDPVFMPDRFALSFAEMPLDVKNRISHRGLAVKKLAEYLAL